MPFVAHDCDKHKKISRVGSYHRAHIFRLVEKASGHIFEIGSGRFLGYSCRGVKNVIFGY